MNKYHLKYELKSIIKDFYVPGFGLLMPLFTAMFFPKLAIANVEAEYANQIVTTIVLATLQNMVLAIFLVSFAVTCALEFKNDIPQRLVLFGVNYPSQIKMKIIVYYLTLIIFMIIYFAILIPFHGITIFSFKSLIIYSLIILLEGISLLFIGYGIALISKSFGITYAITMLLFFVIMALSGTMGVTVEMLPDSVQSITKIFLPFSNLTNIAYDIWSGSSFESGPFIQSLIVLTSIGFIISFIAVWKNKR